MSCCNVSFQSQYARMDGRHNHITIDDYLTELYKSGKTVRCIPNGHELVAVNCTQRRPHFRHKHKGDLEGHPMTEWHCEWQSNFPITEQPFRFKPGQLKDRRADVVIPETKTIIELQHSPITSGEVGDRNRDYGLHDHSVIWLIHGQDSIAVKQLGSRLILHFECNYWLYESFLCCEYVLYDIDGLVYKVKPSLIRSRQIDVQQPVPKSLFIENLNTNKESWIDEEVPQCRLYVKQQGAGSGKTYGMMHALNGDSDVIHFRYVVFLTKQHSAVKVMFNEFADQHKKGLLTNIPSYNVQTDNGGKKQIIQYTHKNTNNEVTVVFATVDSFTYAIGDRECKAYDKFAGIVESIKNGFIKTKTKEGAIDYAGVNPVLNKELLIMIDETQDLNESYGEAFLQLVLSKHTNLGVVGDELQSLSYHNTALTYLKRASKPFLKVIKADENNIVRRFSHQRLIDFVNSVIPFESYGLPSMTSPMGMKQDTHEHSLVIVKGKAVYADKSSDDESVVDAMTHIMDLYHKEVEEYGRVPEDFMFITPFTKKNPLMEALQIALNIYWKNMMGSNTKYIDTVKNKSEYWNTVNPDEYTQYAIFHKSEEGTSINTDESRYATRMVSIHSSKGDKRKVVFVIGVSESALQRFSQITGNLVYDSLLHVAITRQQERLYFRLEKDSDDIARRICKYINAFDVDIKMQPSDEFDTPSDSIKLHTVTRYLQQDNYTDIDRELIMPAELPMLSPLTGTKRIVDMGDHNIRYASLYMNVIVHSCNHQLGKDVKKQNYAILYAIRDADVKIINNSKDYWSILKDNVESNKQTSKSSTPKKYIPVIQFPHRNDTEDYARYYTVILQTIYKIKELLLSLGKTPMRYLCPLESVILYYMWQTVKNGKYHQITINDVYKIVHVYSRSFDISIEHHSDCVCRECFTAVESNTMDEKQKQYLEYLKKHYEMLTQTNKTLDSIDALHPNINWLYEHPVSFQGGTDECRSGHFNLNHRFAMIGYDDTTVINLRLLPQFTELNYNEIIINSAMESWLLLNVEKDSDNYERFKDKPVVTYIVSLDRDAAYRMDWTDTVKYQSKYIKSIVANAVIKIYENYHTQYYDAFCHLLENCKHKPDRILEILRSEKINTSTRHDSNGDNKPKPILQYISDAIGQMASRIADCDKLKDKRAALEKHLVKENFMELFRAKLTRSVEGYLGIDEEDEEEDNDE